MKIIYVRYSTADQDKGHSIETQITNILKKYNLNIKEVLVLIDKALSGFTSDRENYKKIIETLEQGNSINLYAYKSDRLNRNVLNHQYLLNLIESTNSKLFVVAGEVDLGTASGKLLSDIESVFSEYERNITSERTKATIQNLREKRKHTGGKPPLGISVDVDKNLYYDENAYIVLEIFRLYYQEFLSSSKIREKIKLLDPEINFSKNRIYAILNNTLYLGYKMNKGIRYEYFSKPLINEENLKREILNFEKVNRINKKINNTKHSYLFNNILLIDNNHPRVETKNKNGKIYKYYKYNDFTIQEEFLLKKINERVGDVVSDNIAKNITTLIYSNQIDLAIAELKKLKEKKILDLVKIKWIKVFSKTNRIDFEYDNKKYIVKF